MREKTFSACNKFPDSGKQAVDFFGGVVVDQADAKDATFRLDAEALGKIHGVEIAVPGEDAAVAEELCNFCGVMVAHAERKSRAALAKALGVGNAVDSNAGNRLQAFQKF